VILQLAEIVAVVSGIILYVIVIQEFLLGLLVHQADDFLKIAELAGACQQSFLIQLLDSLNILEL